MPYTSWDELRLCNETDVRNRLTRPETALSLEVTAEATTVLPKKIDVATSRIRRIILGYAHSVFDSKVQDVRTSATHRLRRANEQAASVLEANGVDSLVPSLVTGAGLADTFVSEMLTGGRPISWSYAGVPINGTSGTYAGNADPGEFLCDTRNQTVYVNRGTLSSPTWEEFKVEDLLDYIANPSELKDAAVTGTIVASLEDGTLSAVTRSLDNTHLLGEIHDRWEKTFQTTMKETLPLIVFDVSGEGTISTEERTNMQVAHLFY